MNILLIVRPYPAWDRPRFNLQTGAVEVPADTPAGMTAFGEGTWVLNPGDRAALDAALGEGSGFRVQGSGFRVEDAVGHGSAVDGQLTAVALATAEAGAAEAALREALARGAQRAILITGAEDADSYQATSAIAAAIRRLPDGERPDLVVLGAEGPSGAPDEIGPMLAEELGWGQVTGAISLAPSRAGARSHSARVQADQHWVGGLRTVVAALPLVVSLLPNPALPARYAVAGNVLAAFRTATVESVADLTLPSDSGPRVTVRRAALAEAPPVERLTGPLDESVAVLVQGLRQLL
jgi:electron transfer flavoprotein beta subunit